MLVFNGFFPYNNYERFIGGVVQRGHHQLMVQVMDLVQTVYWSQAADKYG
jgi:hypothetical protein